MRAAYRPRWSLLRGKLTGRYAPAIALRARVGRASAEREATHAVVRLHTPLWGVSLTSCALLLPRLQAWIEQAKESQRIKEVGTALLELESGVKARRTAPSASPIAPLSVSLHAV